MQSFNDQSAAAQAAFSGLLEALVSARVQRCAANLPGGFAKKVVRNKVYWYYQCKTPDGKPRQIFVGPDDAPTRDHIEQRADAPARAEHLLRLARAAAVLGCYSAIPKHFRVVQRMADHGLFEAGALLVGTHAFLAYQNHLGLTWHEAGRTVDLDFAHPGRNISVAIVPHARFDTRSAIESLKMGFVPIASGTTFKKSDEPDFDLDFLTSRVADNSDPIDCPALNIKLQPMRFMEFSLRDPLQTALIGSTGAVLVGLPAPERYAVHKLLVCTARPAAQAGKARKDMHQAFLLISYFMQRNPQPLIDAWRQATAAGPAWRKALASGAQALRKELPPSAALLDEVLHLAQAQDAADRDEQSAHPRDRRGG